MGHFRREGLRLASERGHPAVLAELRDIYSASNHQGHSQRCPAVLRTWQAAWSEFTPYLAYPPEIRKVVYSTNLI
ncbi:transposase, partial [Streptomyces sp. NRRL F-5122]|uniref:transposase n=1 Tax=Streptomyces sp. NRRL F-5122 TaxID=1609098 RepID=UPI001F2F3718